MATADPTTTRPIVNTWPKLAAAVAAVMLLSAPSAVGVARALEPTRGPWAAWAAAAGFELAYLSLSLLTLRPELRRQARAVALGAVFTAVALNTLADYAHRVPGGLSAWPTFRATFDPLALGLALGESLPLAGLAFALASLLHRLAEQPAEDALAPAAPAGGGGGSASPAWAGPVLIASPAASWAREFPAPVAVRPEVSGGDATKRPAWPGGRADGAVYRAATRNLPTRSASPAPGAEGVASVATLPQVDAGAGEGGASERRYTCKRCGASGFSFAELGRHSRTCKG